jgi:MFS family permease
VPALFIGAFSTALYAFGQGYWLLLSGRLLWGIAWSGIWVSGNAIVMDVATPQNRGRLVGIYNVAFFTGAGSGSFLGGWLTDWLGYQQTFTIEAALAALGAIVALLILPETKQFAAKSNQVPVNGNQVKKGPTPHLLPIRWGELISANGLMTVNRIVGAGLLLPTFGLYLAGVLGDGVVLGGRTIGTTTLTGFGLSLSTYLGMMFVPLAGGVSDRLGNRWRVVVLGLLPGIIGFLLLSLSLPWVILLGLIGFSMTSGSNQGLSTALVGDLAGEQQRGRWLGILFTMGDLGSAIGPIVVFALIDQLSLPLLYTGAAGLLGLMWVVALVWSRRTAAAAMAQVV